MRSPVLNQIDERVKLLRKECWREIHEHAAPNQAMHCCGSIPS